MQNKTEVIWVDTPEQLAEVCGKAQSFGAVALDTEADSLHVYYAKTCLIQLSFADTHVLIDPLRISPEALKPLGSILADPGIRKILHGADYDVRMLQKDFAFTVKNLADTQLAAQVIGEKQTSLAALVVKELQVQLEKNWQRANWAIRPLSAEMVAYATADTRYLEELLARLLMRLEELGRMSWWKEECECLEQVVYEPPSPDPWPFLRVKGARALPSEALGRLAALWHFRERLAQDENLPPFRILSSETLLRLAQEVPRDLANLARTPGVHGRLVRRRGDDILRILSQSPPLILQKPSHRPPNIIQERTVTKLRRVRDEIAHRLGIDPGFLAPRAVLEAVAETLPQSEEEWLICLKRRWRVGVLRDALQGALVGS